MNHEDYTMQILKEIKAEIKDMRSDITAMKEKNIEQDWRIKNVSGRVALIVSLVATAFMKVVFRMAGV